MSDSGQVEATEDRPLRAVDPLGLSIDPVDAQAGAITHDVNNLLSAILGHAQVALTERDLPVGAEGDLHEITRAARRRRC